MRILVCGGRNFSDAKMMKAALDRHDFSYLISGAQHQGWKIGADWLAIQYAVNRQIPFMGVPAEWDRLGKGAGFIRNQRMIDLWQPEKCIAFPGGNGTQDMIRRAKAANIPVVLVGW